MTAHNEAKKEEIASTVLMPGDPLRAKYIADNFLTDAKQVNTVRNMFAYTGFYKGKKITVMASGMGMPSMGIYSYELYKFYDVENIIRIGTAGAYSKDIDLFSVILESEAYTFSSFAKMQGYDSNTIKSNDELNNVIKNVASSNNIKLLEGKVHSSDLFYTDKDYTYLYEEEGCLCVEMESFALLYNAYKLNKKATCIITVSDNLITKEETTPEQRQNSFNEMIKLALESAISL